MMTTMMMMIVMMMIAVSSPARVLMLLTAMPRRLGAVGENIRERRWPALVTHTPASTPRHSDPPPSHPDRTTLSAEEHLFNTLTRWHAQWAHVHVCIIGMCAHGGETDPIRGQWIAGFNEIVAGDSLTSLSRLVGNIKICGNTGWWWGGGLGGSLEEWRTWNMAKRKWSDGLARVKNTHGQGLKYANRKCFEYNWGKRAAVIIYMLTSHRPGGGSI